MKRSLLLLPALALALAACTPASPESAAAPTAAPEETSAPATAETAAFPVGQLVEGNASLLTGDAGYTLEYDTLPDGNMLPRIMKLDFTTATEEKIVQMEEPIGNFEAFFMRGDTAYLATDGGVLHIPLDGGAITTTELQAPLSDYSFFAGDEYARYGFSFYAGRGYRMDLQTGQFTDFPLPAQMELIRAVGTDRFLVTRLLTEAPLPNVHTENEQYYAALQNTTREFDWFDPATGELEKIYAEPYYGVLQEDGTQQERSFLGMAGGRLYFRNVHVLRQGPGAEVLGEEVVSCTPEGEDWQTAFTLPEGFYTPQPICDTAMEMRWLLLNEEAGGSQIYDLADGSWHTMGPFDVGFGYPAAFTGDGRVLVRTGELWVEDTYRITYTLIDIEDYLNGSTEGTPVTPYTG